MKRAFLLFVFFLLKETGLHAQDLYDLNSLTKIEITLTQPNWDYQMDTAKSGSEGYLMAAQVIINGTSFDSVGIKYKGNSSYDSSKLKNPLHISINEFKDQKYQGYADIKLGNGYADPSMIREVLAYQILQNYMHCPKANFAQVYINGTYIGLYSSAENIDKNFCADHFYSSQNTFLKCNPTVNPGPTTKSNFKFINNDTSSYALYYELKSKLGWHDLVNLCDSVSNHPSTLESVVDMDRVIWMLAFNNALVNLDSYNGVFAQNHYIYQDNTGHYNPIIWDLNMCFGGFPFTGAGATSMGALTIAGEQTLATDNHATDTYWPLINAVHSNPVWKRKYYAHMRTIIGEFFVNHLYDTLASQCHTITDTACYSDNNKFFTYNQFLNSMDSSVVNGSYSVPGIRQLMDARVTYLQTVPEFISTAPMFITIHASVPSPAYASTFTMLATVSNVNTGTVWLGYRFDKTKKFTLLQLFDDGSHNDGASGDGVFGNDVMMNGGAMQYYVYAENADAGIFSPARAEHEFYTLAAQSTPATAGTVVINELLADNVNNVTDEYNQHDDWVEFYNNSTQLIDMSGLYLSDDITNLTKWSFPAGTYIEPNGFLVVWTDDDANQQILHSNFSLNKDSGHLILSNGTGILDSISITGQQADTTFGRYPNGTGPFTKMNTTFAAWNNNYALPVKNYTLVNSIRVYPSPASEWVWIETTTNQTLEITDLKGSTMYRNTSGTMKHKINVSNWPAGTYLVHSGEQTQKLLVH
ncbi:MAG TPA: CotH kinase family protein [Chitinophagaceae bacterium]|nr:CotH kinase family protein [Chitinophagaceae bacterium]